MRTWLLTLALLLVALPVSAAELSIQPRVGYTLLGFDSPTGGPSVGITVRGVFKLQDAPSVGVYAGAGGEVIGVTGDWYHMGIIAGPRAGVWYQHKALFLSGGLGLLYGQLSTCRTWDIDGVRQCMRWWNGWPELAGHVGYRGDDVHVGLDVTGMLIRTLWGVDGSLGLGVSGSYR